MSSIHLAKKQKGDKGEATASTVGAGGDDKCLVQELNAIKSAMHQLLDHSHSQTTIVASMHVEMKAMQGEIIHLREKCDAMEKLMQKTHDQVDSGFGDVENKLKYHEVLLKNQKWKYSAPLPAVDSRHEALTMDARYFLRAIERKTSDMRYGKSRLGKIHLISQSGSLTPHDAAFLPHWKEFAEALQEYRYALQTLPKEAMTEFCIEGVELQHDVLRLLFNALESTFFKNFHLARNNNLGHCGTQLLLEYLRNNPILDSFGLDSSILHNDEVSKLSEIVEEHPSIRHIQLLGCCGEGINGYGMLCSIVSAGANKLKSIDLGSNGISSGGSTFISDFLATNPPLESLELNTNQLDDNDAITIASALSHNTNLQFLDLTENPITMAGWAELNKAELDPTSLTSAAESNHTCHIYYPDEFFDSDYDGEGMNFGRQFRKVRQMKIYYVLSCRNILGSNVQHLDNVPVKFLPDILGTIQQYSEYHLGDNAFDQACDDVNSLSIVYEIMRKWDKAFEIYESLSTNSR